MKTIREKLAELGRELQRAGDVDIDKDRELEELNRQVDRLEASEASDVDFLVDRVKRLETQFASEHPTLARIARELADALAKMGI